MDYDVGYTPHEGFGCISDAALTIVNNNNNIIANVNLYDSGLAGTPTLTDADQLTLSGATKQVSA